MSRDIDVSKLDSLSSGDLKYLHDRNQITDEQLAEGLGRNVGEVRRALASPSRTQADLEEEENLGDVGTVGDENLVGNRPPPPQESETLEISEMTKVQLQEEIDRRNEDRPEENRLSRSGTKEELLERLQADEG